MSGALLADTLRALARPRRAIPITLVSAALIGAQVYFTPTFAAFAVAALLCGVFVALGPASWRLLFPAEREVDGRVWRLALYGGLGLSFTGAFGWALPQVLGLPATFLTATGSLVIEPVLFWVGGWGLARDIDLEQGLRRANARAEALAREAERSQLMAIRSHLDPHFLFNTLNAIAEWCREDGEVAERAILKLSAMLRAVLDGVRAPVWPLAREMALVDALFELHLVRDPGLFSLVRVVADGALAVSVPPLILLPLAENAMTHGPGAGHRGELRLEVSEDGGRLHVSLTNPGRWAPMGDAGQGLAMVRRRLELAYGAEGRLEVGPASGRAGVTADLWLPVTRVPMVVT